MSNQLETLLGKAWGWFVAIGLVSLLGGILALAHPFAASFTVAMIASWVFLLIGSMQVVHAFRLRGWPGHYSTLLFGLLMIVMALIFMLDPLSGVMSLTLLVAVIFALLGVAKLTFSFHVRPRKGWVWVMLSGLGSLALAAIILVNYPVGAVAILGLLFGIELLFNGSAFIMLGLAFRRLG